MKNLTCFGLSSLAMKYGRHAKSAPPPHLCLLALTDCKAKRGNGTDTDNPSRSMPRDGTYTWETPNEEYSKIRYTEGSSDQAWMEERDRNYLARLEREGRLRVSKTSTNSEEKEDDEENEKKEEVDPLESSSLFSK